MSSWSGWASNGMLVSTLRSRYEHFLSYENTEMQNLITHYIRQFP
jgi:hypothetical protein